MRNYLALFIIAGATLIFLGFLPQGQSSEDAVETFIYEIPYSVTSPALIPPEIPVYPLPPDQRNWVQKIFDGWYPSTYSHAKQLMKAVHYKASFVQLVKNRIAPQHFTDSLNLGKVCDIYDYLYSKKLPEEDPDGREYFCPPEKYWKEHRGDCDDMAICLAAACNAIGGYARIVLAANETGHAYVELWLGKSTPRPYLEYIIKRYNLNRTATHPFIRKDHNNEYWLNLDLKDPYPGGPYFDGEVYHHYYPAKGLWDDLKKK